MERAGRKAGSGIKKNRHRGMYGLRCFLWHAPVELGEYDKSPLMWGFIYRYFTGFCYSNKDNALFRPEA